MSNTFFFFFFFYFFFPFFFLLFAFWNSLAKLFPCHCRRDVTINETIRSLPVQTKDNLKYDFSFDLFCIPLIYRVIGRLDLSHNSFYFIIFNTIIFLLLFNRAFIFNFYWLITILIVLSPRLSFVYTFFLIYSSITNNLIVNQ